MVQWDKSICQISNVENAKKNLNLIDIKVNVNCAVAPQVEENRYVQEEENTRPDRLFLSKKRIKLNRHLIENIVNFNWAINLWT